MKRLSIMAVIALAILLSGCEVDRPKPLLNLDNLNWGIEMQIAIDKAKTVYQEAVNQGVNLTNGPCLSNYLHGNLDYPETVWVLDIAHNPRTEVDNQPANQCQAFQEGRAQNFIEMDEDGRIIAVYSPFIRK